MPSRFAVCAAVFVSIALCGASLADTSRKTLQAFSSEQELSDLLAQFAQERKRRYEEERRKTAEELRLWRAENPGKPLGKPWIKHWIGPASNPFQQELVTDLEHDFDRPGIVKLRGHHLVILQRGRLFTVDIRGEQLKSVSSIDAFAPGTDPGRNSYDQVLLWGDAIAVIGRTFPGNEAINTEVGLFRISAAGELSHTATYHL